MKKLIPLILVLSFFFYCGPKQEKVEKIIKDGVEVVFNHLEPYKIKGEPSQLSLEEEFIIDFERNDLAELRIDGTAGFDVDSEGNIYCICTDRDDNQIAKFNRYGKFVTSFGHKGQGPGELEEPSSSSFRVNELDQIIVSDYRKKICLFNNNGDLVKEIRLDPKFEMATLLGNGKILVGKPIRKPEEERTELPIILCSENLEEINILHTGKRLVMLSRAKKINPLSIYYFHYYWKVSKGLIYIGNYSNEYEILIYGTEGNLMRKIRKKYNQVPVPNTLKKKILNRFENHPMNEQLRLKEKVYFPKFYPPYQFFFVDEKSRLYVMSFERGKGPNNFIYDIFNPDGLFVGRMVLDNCVYWPQSSIKIPSEVVAKNNRIHCLREKESGYQELVVYKMIWD